MFACLGTDRRTRFSQLASQEVDGGSGDEGFVPASFGGELDADDEFEFVFESTAMPFCNGIVVDENDLPCQSSLIP